MKLVAPMTERRLKAFTKNTACGVVPGFCVRVVKLKDGNLARYFSLRERSINRTFTLGKYPDMSLSEAFRKASEWKKKIAQGVDPAAEKKALKDSLRRQRDLDPGESDILTFEKLIRACIEFNEKRGRWSKKTARCLAFAILTAARNSTAREATWDEIQQDDDGNRLHVIPRERMKVKSGKIPFDRKTPLSP